MSNEKVIIEVDGSDAASAAAELSKIIEAEFSITPILTTPEHLRPEDAADKKLDPVLAGVVIGAAGVMLAIPAAVLASFQLKDRLAKKNGFDRLVSEGKKIKATKKLTSLRFRIGNTEIEFAKATYAKISDHLE